MTGPGPSQFVIVADIGVPWEQANRKHRLHIELVDLDGNPVATIGNDDPLAIDMEFETGRPPAGIRPGTMLPVQLILPSPGFVQFPPGGHFEFRLTSMTRPSRTGVCRSAPAQ